MTYFGQVTYCVYGLYTVLYTVTHYPLKDIIMFKSLFDQKTLTLFILILSVINASSAIVSHDWPVFFGWVSSVAGWYAVWDLTKGQ